MAGLDRNRSYAQVFGDDLGRAYEQDGEYFRADGSLWSAAALDAAAQPAATPAKPPKKSMSKTAPEAEPAPAPTADDAQLTAQLADKAA